MAINATVSSGPKDRGDPGKATDGSSNTSWVPVPHKSSKTLYITTNQRYLFHKADINIGDNIGVSDMRNFRLEYDNSTNGSGNWQTAPGARICGRPSGMKYVSIPFSTPFYASRFRLILDSHQVDVKEFRLYKIKYESSSARMTASMGNFTLVDVPKQQTAHPVEEGFVLDYNQFPEVDFSFQAANQKDSIRLYVDNQYHRTEYVSNPDKNFYYQTLLNEGVHYLKAIAYGAQTDTLESGFKVINASVAQEQAGYRVYPNPVEDYLNVESPKLTYYEVFDTNGKVVVRGQVFGRQRIPVSRLSGSSRKLYFIRMSNPELTITRKLIFK